MKPHDEGKDLLEGYIMFIVAWGFFWGAMIWAVS